MGNLKPGVSYIYESPDKGKTIYARESGTNERKIVGGMYETEDRMFGVPMSELSQLVLIYLAAKDNPTLHAALERVKVIYNLSIEHGA